MGSEVVFDASATLAETRNATWDPYAIVHLPTTLQAYKYTSGRKFNITGKLVSRTAYEADQNADYLDLIRSWVLPDFGGTGATPPIVRLSGYRNGNVDNLKCVITAYSWTFPEDVDYIFTSRQPMPVIAQITVELDEIYSAYEVTQVYPWKISLGMSKSQANTVADVAADNFLSETMPLTEMVSSNFQGIATVASQAAKSISTPASIISNPTFGKITGIKNSGELSAVSKGIPSVNNNPFITGVSSGILPGESGGVPTKSPLRTIDSFSRRDFKVDGFTFE